MIDDDKKQFKIVLDLMCDGLNVIRFNKETLLSWFNGLSDYTIQDVTEKIDHYIEIHNSLPTLEAIQKHEVTIKPRVVTPLTVENNKSHMKEVKAEIKGFSNKDGKAWARKILADDKGKTQLQINYAKEALGLPK